MSSREYTPGDIVFAKLKGYPWWPARVENDKDIPPKVLKQKGKSKGVLYTVFFYGSRDYGFFGPDCVRPFDRETVERDLKAKKFKTKDLELAIHQALDPSLLKAEEEAEAAAAAAAEAEEEEEEEEEVMTKRKRGKGTRSSDKTNDKKKKGSATETKKRNNSSSASRRKTYEEEEEEEEEEEVVESRPKRKRAANNRPTKRSRGENNSSSETNGTDTKKRRKSLSTEQEEDSMQNKRESSTISNKSEEPNNNTNNQSLGNGNIEAQKDIDAFKKTPEYKRIYHIRHKLQKLVYEKKPGEIRKEDFVKISLVVKEIEESQMTFNLLRYTKIGKVVKCACSYDYGEDEYKIGQRCQQLMRNWKTLILPFNSNNNNASAVQQQS
ncbi:MAG: hypothetical protein EXX96DRAFT_610576 [Benjaminiella poitrasii]|nr:MAG: hypothetical protein EXX96DRAFT_610576 [Benjaminiella poitrasii]